MLEIKAVTKKFGNDIAVDHLNMVLEPGRVMGLIGQNGAGKTTTFRMILDFIQPTSGSILWNNQPIDLKAKQRIGFLPEERGLYQKITVEEQILYFAELHGMRRSDARQALMEWMKRLDVVGKVTDKVQKLSKGNAQKVQLIASVIFQPEFVILDEPFSGLDPVNMSIMMSEIQRLRDQGAMIIFSSHDMNNVSHISDDLTMLKKGKTVLQGGLKEIRERYGRTKLYIESPLTMSQLRSIPGVTQVTAQENGLLVELAAENVVKVIFEKATAKGLIRTFTQHQRTLHDISRMELVAQV